MKNDSSLSYIEALMFGADRSACSPPARSTWEPPYPGLMDTEHVADARQGIQSVENAMTVLLALERGAGPMALTQIAESCGMRLEEFKVVAPATVSTDRREQCSAR
jgi:hypothetical protein